MAVGARIIWIMFGDMGGATSVQEELTAHYQGLKKDADGSGITLGFPRGTVTRQAFLKLICEAATVAFVWHSHGEYTPFATGNMLAAGGEPIRASEVARFPVSKRLQFAALLGCGAFSSESIRQAWLRAFGLDRLSEPTRRLYAFGGTITAKEMRTFSERHTYGQVGPYRFPDWLGMVSV